MRRLAIIGVVVMALAACGTAQEPLAQLDTTSTTAFNTTTTTGTGPTSTMPPLSPDQISHVDAAKADLAQRLGVAVTEVTVIKFKDVTWPDGSLGCPEPGMSYTEALVDGYQVTLTQGDRLFDYHGANGSDPILCKSGEKDGGREFVPPPGFDE